MRNAALSTTAKYANANYIDVYDLDKDLYRSFEAADGFHMNDEGIEYLLELTFQ